MSVLFLAGTDVAFPFVLRLGVISDVATTECLRFFPILLFFFFGVCKNLYRCKSPVLLRIIFGNAIRVNRELNCLR
eukprot:UN05116